MGESDLTEKIDEKMKEIAANLEQVRIQIEAIKSTHGQLKEFIFQTFLTARTEEALDKKAEILVDAMQQISKYSDQEIQKYLNTIANLSGQMQGLQQSRQMMNNNQEEDTDDSSSSAKEQVAPAEVSA